MGIICTSIGIFVLALVVLVSNGDFCTTYTGGSSIEFFLMAEFMSEYLVRILH